MKKVLLLFLITIFCLTILVACNNNTQLSAPTISADDNMVIWQGVPYAKEYKVYVNGAEKATTTNNYFELTETTPGNYAIKVIAVGDGENYSDSSFSNEVTITVKESVLSVYVTDAPFNAKGDGKSSDRAAIQSAIDYVSQQGGGKVILTGNKTFLSGNLVLYSNINLHFEDGALLKQNPDDGDYVEAVGWIAEVGTPTEPMWGSWVDEWSDVRWGHTWIWNYPLIYAGEGTTNVKVTGNGTITMMEHKSCEETMHTEPLGFYKVDGLEVSGITIDGYNGWCFDIYNCQNVLIKGMTIRNFQCGCSDGLHLNYSSNVLVTDCNFATGDDAIAIFSNYLDPRLVRWMKNDEMVYVHDIEICNSTFTSDGEGTKGLAIFPIGLLAPEQEKVEISNVYIHDNTFNSVGVWSSYNMWGSDSYLGLKGAVPMKDWVWENNKVGIVQSGVVDLLVSGFNSDDDRLRSIPQFMNGDFDSLGTSYWIMKDENGSKSSVIKEGNNKIGAIQELDKGDAKIYEGLYLLGNMQYNFNCKVKSSGDTCRFFVRDCKTNELIYSKEFNNTEWQTLEAKISVPQSGNYLVGIERGNATKGWAYIDDANLQLPYEFYSTPNYKTNPTETEWIQGYNVVPSEQSRLQSEQVVKVGYYLTVNEIIDSARFMQFSPLIQRMSEGYSTVGEGTSTVEYSSMQKGKWLFVFTMKLPSNFDSTDDSIALRIRTNSGIDFVIDRIIVADEDFNFTFDDEYSLACEQALTGSLGIAQEGVIYSAEPKYTTQGLPDGEYVQGYNIFGSKDNQLVNGQKVQIAYYVTVESKGETDYAQFCPLVQRQSENWATILNCNYLLNNQLVVGKNLLIFSWTLGGSFHPELDTLASRLYVSSGMILTVDKFIVAEENYSLSTNGYPVVANVDIDEELIKNKTYYDASSGYSFDGVGTGKFFGLNMSANTSDAKASEEVVIAFFMTINDITSTQGQLDFGAIVQRSTQGWAIIDGGEYFAKVDYANLLQGKVVVVVTLNLPQGFDATVDAISPELNISSGLDVAFQRIIIAPSNYDFSQTGYTPINAENIEKPIDKNTPYYDASSVYSFNGVGEGKFFGLNMGANTSNAEAGEEVVIAFFTTINDIITTDGQLSFKAIAQRSTQDWALLNGGTFTVQIDYAQLSEGQVVIVVKMQLPQDFDATVDAISPELNISSGLDVSFHRIIVAPSTFDFSQTGYTVVNATATAS